MTNRLSITAFILCLFVTGNVMAQQEQTASTTDLNKSNIHANQALNMCPLAVAFGIYAVNYEYLINQTHGIVGRIDYESISDSYSGDPIEASGLSFTLNYRWHLSGAMESLFLGSFVRYRMYDGDGTSGTTKFDFNMDEVTFGLNAGKRWVWNNGFNITFSLGYGIAKLDKEKNPNSASVKSTINKFEEDYDFIGPFLGEFSIGYAF
jgi:hypothetical protein